jgi:hypothetical protein
MERVGAGAVFETDTAGDAIWTDQVATAYGPAYSAKLSTP